MKNSKLGILLVAFLIMAATFSATKAQTQQIERKELGVAELGTTEINKVDMREITLKPSQKTGLHLHPGGVVGYVAAGEILFQIEGHEPKILKTGDSFFEPPNARIAHFDNNSKKRSAKFSAFYLLKNGQELIEMLEP